MERRYEAPPSDQPSHNEFVFSKRKRLENTALIRQRLAQLHHEVADSNFNNALLQQGLVPPARTLSSVTENGRLTYLLDRQKQTVYSEFIRRTGLQLPVFVRLLRGESVVDPRPNRSLEEPFEATTWRNYIYRPQWESIVRHGVISAWQTTFKPQSAAPANHGSASRALNIIVKHLRAGQDSNRYLSLDIDLLPSLWDVTCSLFGAVNIANAPFTSPVNIRCNVVNTSAMSIIRLAKASGPS